MNANPPKKLRIRDLVVGGRYLHVNGAWVREIISIDGHTVQYRDEFGTGSCSKSAFLKRCPSLAPERALGNRSRPWAKPPGNLEFTLRDEANALTAFAFRNGFIEELHAGKASPLLREPGFSRITDEEMRRLMIEASEKLSKMLQLKSSEPEKYDAFIRDYHDRYCRGWKRDWPVNGRIHSRCALRDRERAYWLSRRVRRTSAIKSDISELDGWKCVSWVAENRVALAHSSRTRPQLIGAPPLLGHKSAVDQLIFRKRMISISPIYQTDGDKPFREFFVPEFRSQRLGHPGCWQGEGAELLGFKNPIELETFQHLLSGQTPDGAKPLLTEPSNQRRELGWRVTVAASPCLTVLWALAPEPVRERLEYTHATCADFALRKIELAMSDWDWVQDENRMEYGGAVFAKFRCGAASDQTPNLHTTAFLFNLAFHVDGTIGTFTSSEVLRQRFQLQTTYELHRDVRLCDDIGAYRQMCGGVDLRIEGVPQELCRRFFFDSSFSPQKDVGLGQVAAPLRSEQLFAKWQEKADEWGWGPKQAESFLRGARQERLRRVRAGKWRYRIYRGSLLCHRVRNSLPKLMRGEDKRSQEQGSGQSKDKGQTRSR